MSRSVGSSSRQPAGATRRSDTVSQNTCWHPVPAWMGKKRGKNKKVSWWWEKKNEQNANKLSLILILNLLKVK